MEERGSHRERDFRCWAGLRVERDKAISFEMKQPSAIVEADTRRREHDRGRRSVLCG